jgi:hypothetical protein
MDLLKNYIDSLLKEEIRAYKLFAKRSNDRKERKDVVLFDIYKGKKEVDTTAIFKRLYKVGDVNTFYRLKNRLIEDIGTSLLLLNADRGDVFSVFKHLSLFQLFVERENYDLALFHLKKAERKAQRNSNLELLDLVYANYIKISTETIEINPEIYILKRNENAIELNKARKIDQLLAALSYRLKLSQNYASSDKSLLKIVDKTFKEYAADKSITEVKRYQTKIYKAISQVLVQQHNFIELEIYALTTFAHFEKRDWFDKSNHDLKLQMIIYIVNAKFYNHKHDESLRYADLLAKEMEAFNRLHFERYLFFYYNSLVVNYAFTNFDEALKKLDEFERLMRKRKNKFYDQFIYLNRATLLYEVKKYDEAVRNLMKLYASPVYEQLDESFKLKIAIAELILQYEAGDNKLVLKLVEQVSKNSLVKDNLEFNRERSLLKILESLAKSYRLKPNNKIEKAILNFIKKPIDAGVEESEVIKYNSWIRKQIDYLNK